MKNFHLPGLCSLVFVAQVFVASMALAETTTFQTPSTNTVISSHPAANEFDPIGTTEYVYQVPKFDSSLGVLDHIRIESSYFFTRAEMGMEWLGTGYSQFIYDNNPPSLWADVRVYPRHSIPSIGYPEFGEGSSSWDVLLDGQVGHATSDFDGTVDYAGDSGFNRVWQPGVDPVGHPFDIPLVQLGAIWDAPRLATLTGTGNWQLDASVEISRGGTWSQPSIVYQEYEWDTSTLVTFDFDRVGASVALTLSGNEISGTQPSYVSGTGANATRAALLDSEALASNTNVAMSFTDTGNAAFATGAGTLALNSEILDVSGLDGSLFVLEMSYDDSSLILPETDALLAWFNESEGEWQNAVLGNSDIETAMGELGVLEYLELMKFNGSYSGYLFTNGLTSPELGAFGVDTSANKVWAVLDHNSFFGAAPSATVIPEPSTALLLGLGLTGLAAKGRRRS